MARAIIINITELELLRVVWTQYKQALWIGLKNVQVQKFY